MRLAKLAPPKKKSLQVAEQLLELIRAGTLVAGSQLPPERILVEQLGVSRTVVREALSALQLSGILESHVGDGTYVAKAISPGDTSFSSILEKVTASVSLVQAIQAREALDISVAHLAIENSRPENVAILQQLVDKMRDAVDARDFHRYIDLALDFHVQIAKMASNPILEEVVVYLIRVVRPHLWVIEQNYARLGANESLAVHVGILEGIRTANIEMVIDSVRKHYQEYPALYR